MPAKVNIAAQANPLSRRRFLLQALGISAAGLAMGGGGAWVKGRLDEGAAAQAALQELQAQLGAAAEGSSTVADVVVALQSQLASATGQNAQLATALSNAQQEIDGLKSQLGSTTSQLNVTADQLANHKMLVSLYEQLEAAGLDTVVQGGLSAAAGGLSTALGLGPVVNDGLTLATNLLDNFEQTLPSFREAMTWLGDQVVALRLSLYTIETTARKTINAALTGLTSVFGGFIKFVLNYLPFNIGANVRATLEAAQTLFGGLTATLDGADQKILGTISPLVSDGPQDLGKTLVNPLREKALTPTNQLLSALTEANKVFVNSLESPARVALSQRADVAARIAAFRAANHL